MKRSRFSDEQIIAVLKEHENGAKRDELCRRHGISPATFYAWRKKLGGMEVSDARKLRALGRERPAEAHRRRAGARSVGDEGDRRKKLVTPMAKRKAVGFLESEFCLSERHACRIVRLARSVAQYRPIPRNDEAATARLKELASTNRRYGYKRLHALMRREGLVANHKRTYRLYLQEGLQVRTKKRRKLPRRDRVPILVPARPNERWSLDFVSDQLMTCRRFRVLNIVDDHSKLCPGQIVDVSISGEKLADFLDDLGETHGLPKEIVLDNGPEGTSKAMFGWSERTGVALRFIEPGKPVQNARRVVQRPVPRRMPEPELVPLAASRPRRDRGMAHPLQSYFITPICLCG